MRQVAMARSQAEWVEAIKARLGTRSIVMIGLMGCGKSTVGRRLASTLELPFVDADTEIERAASKSIPEIFADHGEAYFRAGERRVIGRLLERPSGVLATGGGAYMDAETRAAVKRNGISIWLKADLEILMRRVMRRDNRPLLKTEDPRATMQRLMAERYPVYAGADITIESRDVNHDVVVGEILEKLARRMVVETGEGERHDP